MDRQAGTQTNHWANIRLTGLVSDGLKEEVTFELRSE